jgi:hypothetical protein
MAVQKVDAAVSIKTSMASKLGQEAAKDSTIGTGSRHLGCCCINQFSLSTYYMFYTK